MSLNGVCDKKNTGIKVVKLPGKLFSRTLCTNSRRAFIRSAFQICKHFKLNLSYVIQSRNPCLPKQIGCSNDSPYQIGQSLVQWYISKLICCCLFLFFVILTCCCTCVIKSYRLLGMEATRCAMLINYLLSSLF